jgi:hypothetical protein
MAKTNPYEYLYREEDRSYAINDLDPDRRTIVLSLPTAPKRKDLIDGHGLHPDEQYFRRLEMPKRLKSLEAEVIGELQELQKQNRQETITGYKIIDRFWSKIEDNPEEYETEIAFIQKVWWHRLYGYWFYNDGQPTFITGRHFMFLNFFYMPDVKENEGFPEYRDRHRREFLFRDYLRSATETFARRDEKGYAVPEEDGTYKMIDVNLRLFYGDILPKSRRNGSTIMGLNDMIEDAERGFGKYSTIISKDGESTEEHYNQHLLPAWANRPFFIRPLWFGSSMPGQIKYIPPKTSFMHEALMSVIDYTVSAAETKKDGSKFSGMIVFDEEGKDSSGADVLVRWDVNKNAMATGDGTKILGYCSHISTVEDISAAGQAFLNMLELSDFYQRGDNGQTTSGLGAYFFPSYDGQEGFIDPFGKSVIDSPTERQLALAPPDAVYAKLGKGAKQYQGEKRDDFLKKGTPSAMQSYRAYIKKYPWRSNELFIGTSGDLGFNYEKMDSRLAELRKLKSLDKLPLKVGNFYRSNNDPEGRVFWRTEPDKGKFILAMDLPQELTNLKRQGMGWDVNKQDYVPMYEPLRKTKFTVGADPVEFNNDDKSGGSRQSDGGIAVLWEHDSELDRSENPMDWDSRRCVCYYRYRPASLQEYCEDVLMVAEYFSCFIFPENNKTRLWEYILERGRGGFLKYQIDPRTGKRSEKPGYYASEPTKNTLFGEWKDYIETRIHKEVIIELVEEARNIRSMKEMNKYDGFAAFGAALMGSMSPDGKAEERFANLEIDLGGCPFLQSRPL